MQYVQTKVGGAVQPWCAHKVTEVVEDLCELLDDDQLIDLSYSMTEKNFVNAGHIVQDVSQVILTPPILLVTTTTNWIVNWLDMKPKGFKRI